MDFENPNFAAMAKAMGIYGVRLEDPADVERGIAAAFAHDGPVLIDAVVNRTELAMPPSITLEMAKGFTLFMVKGETLLRERPKADFTSMLTMAMGRTSQTPTPGCIENPSPNNLRITSPDAAAR